MDEKKAEEKGNRLKRGFDKLCTLAFYTVISVIIICKSLNHSGRK